LKEVEMNHQRQSSTGVNAAKRVDPANNDSMALIPVLEPDVAETKSNDVATRTGGILGKAKAAAQSQATSLMAKASTVAKTASTKPSALSAMMTLTVAASAGNCDVAPAVPSRREIRDVCRRHAEGSFYFDSEIPAKKLANARASFAIPTSERVIVLVDCTVFGSAKDGVAFGESGLYWKNMLELPLACRWNDLAQATLKSPSEDVDVSIQLASGKLLAINFTGSSFKNGHKLIDDLRALAAEYARGVHPLVALPAAEAEIERGEFDAALTKLREIAEADSCWSRRVLKAGERLCERWSDPDALAWFQEFKARVEDRSATWFVQSQRDHRRKQIGPLSYDDLCRLWREGDIHPNDELKHFGDEGWQPVMRAEPLRDVTRVGFPELGLPIPKQFRRCREELRTQGVFDAPTVFFASTLTLSANKDEPVIHLAFSDRELFLIESASKTSTVVQRCEWEAADWQLTPVKSGSDQYQLRVTIDSQSSELLLAAGTGLEMLRTRIRAIFRERADDCVKERRFFTAEKLLRQLGDEPLPPELQSVLDKIGVVTQVIAMYDGGHPEFTEKLLGALRFDSQGLEFTPLMGGSPMYVRLPYESIVDIQPPQRGQLPAEMAGQLSSKRRQGMWLKTGLQVAACGIPGGALLVGGLMAASNSSGTASGPPMNRICVVAVIQGTPFRMYFDAIAGTAEELNQEAQQFWNKSAQVRNRFKQTASSGGGVPTAELAEQRKLLHEIRDMLVRVLGMQHLTTLQQLLDAGTLTLDEFQKQKTAILSDVWKPESIPEFRTHTRTATSSATVVIVGCPKCDTKLRSKPGIAQCPKCSTKLRVPEPAAIA
jgi:hypothetical protein